MENILGDNFQALHAFGLHIQHNFSRGNKTRKTANVHVTYSRDGYERELITEAWISLDSHPFATIELMDKEWLRSEHFHSRFSTGYGNFSFDIASKTLTITGVGSEQIPGAYQVDIAEV